MVKHTIKQAATIRQLDRHSTSRHRILKKTQDRSSVRKKIITIKNSTNGSVKKYYQLKVKQNDIEFLLLFTTLINIYAFLKNNKVPKSKIKKYIINILKQIRHNNNFITKTTSDEELEKIYILIDTKIGYFKDKINHSNHNHKSDLQKSDQHKGGFYFFEKILISSFS